MNQPNLSAILEQWWGGSYANYATQIVILNASNLVWGGNPPYGPNEFFLLYPQFGGDPVEGLVGQLIADSADIVLSDVSDLLVNQYISDHPTNAILGATQIAVISGTDVTLTSAATANVTNDNLLVYPSPVIPYPVLLTYINLANACLQYNRWLEAWTVGMGLFIAHYCTLWLQSQGAPGSSAGQAAAGGMARGILTSKSAGDVSAGYTPLTGFEDWGAWNLTLFGQQFMTLANIVGFGPMYVW
jgi:Protein of unknown function (DUF4054)